MTNNSNDDRLASSTYREELVFDEGIAFGKAVHKLYTAPPLLAETSCLATISAMVILTWGGVGTLATACMVCVETEVVAIGGVGVGVGELEVAVSSVVQN